MNEAVNDDAIYTTCLCLCHSDETGSLNSKQTEDFSVI